MTVHASVSTVGTDVTMTTYWDDELPDGNIVKVEVVNDDPSRTFRFYVGWADLTLNDSTSPVSSVTVAFQNTTIDVGPASKVTIQPPAYGALGPVEGGGFL